MTKHDDDAGAAAPSGTLSAAAKHARKLARKQMIREGLIAAPKKRTPDAAAGGAKPNAPRPAP
jgi:type IV secretory pathway TrbL component